MGRWPGESEAQKLTEVCFLPHAVGDVEAEHLIRVGRLYHWDARL